jgi:hypothetical protein
MNYSEAAALMIGGTSGNTKQLEIPNEVKFEEVTGYPFNCMITETYAKNEYHSEYQKKIGLSIANLGTPNEYVSNIYFYDNPNITNPYNYDNCVFFSNFYIG